MPYHRKPPNVLPIKKKILQQYIKDGYKDDNRARIFTFQNCDRIELIDNNTIRIVPPTVYITNTSDLNDNKDMITDPSNSIFYVSINDHKYGKSKFNYNEILTNIYNLIDNKDRIKTNTLLKMYEDENQIRFGDNWYRKLGFGMRNTHMIFNVIMEIIEQCQKNDISLKIKLQTSNEKIVIIEN